MPEQKIMIVQELIDTLNKIITEKPEVKDLPVALPSLTYGEDTPMEQEQPLTEVSVEYGRVCLHS